MNSRTKKRTRDHDTKPRWSYLEESTTDESPSPIIAITLPRRENEKKKREVTEDEHHTPWWKDFLLQFIRNQFKLDIHKLDDPGDPSHDRAWKDLHCRVQTLWWEGRDEEMPENFIENTYTILKLKDIFDDCRGSVWEEKDKEMSEAEECKREQAFSKMNSRTKKRTRDHDTKPRWSYLEESTTDESPSPIIAITLPRRENEKKKREVTEDEHHTPWWKDFLLQFIRNQFKLDIHKLDDPGDPSHDRAWKDLHCRVQTLWWEGRDEEMPENFIENTYTILKLKDIFDDCRGSVWEEKDKEMSEAEECKREHEQKIIERGWDRSIVPPHEVATPPEPEYYEHEERNWKISSISTSSGIEYKHERDITPPIYKHEGDITPETDYEEHKGVTTADPENGMDDFEKRADVLTKLHIRFSGRLHFGKVFALAVKRNFEELQPDMVRDAAIAVGLRGDRTLTDVIRQHTPPKNQQYNPPLMFAFDDLIQDKDLVREKDLLRRENNDYDKSHNYEPSYLSCLAEEVTNKLEVTLQT